MVLKNFNYSSQSFFLMWHM